MEDRTVRHVLQNIIKTGLFVGIGIILFLLVQNLLKPKWNYPKMGDNVSYTLESFYQQEKNVDDVLFFGTSHMEFGFSPMQLYRETGVVSYNLAVSAERISGTYFLLREALKTQKPVVVVVDASSLFLEETYENPWRYILDTMPSFIGKIPMAEAYVDFMKELNGETAQEDSASEKTDKKWTLLTDSFGIAADETFQSAMFPMIRYHNRWTELGITDFRDFLPAKNYYTAGYLMHTGHSSSNQTIDSMNSTLRKLEKSRYNRTYEYKDGEVVKTKKKDLLYQPEIGEKNGEWLEKIKALCDAKGVQLLLTKIPAIRNPNEYKSSWTIRRSEYMKEYALEHGIAFFDLVYDTDSGIDVTTDFTDGGDHLNYLGAKKVTTVLGRYLCDTYDLEPREHQVYDDAMPMYDDVSSVAELQLERSLPAYLQKLSDRKEGCVICIAAKDEMHNGLNEEDIDALKALGLDANFTKRPGFHDAYIAVIDGGNKLYEAASTRQLGYTAKVSIGKGKRKETVLSVISSGWNTGSEASVKVDNVSCAVNQIGINIVVIDKETGVVVDSVQFNTHSEAPHACRHRDSLKRLQDYWMEKRSLTE